MTLYPVCHVMHSPPNYRRRQLKRATSAKFTNKCRVNEHMMRPDGVCQSLNFLRARVCGA